MEITHESIWSAVKNRGLDDSFCIGEIKYILHGKLLLILGELGKQLQQCKERLRRPNPLKETLTTQEALVKFLIEHGKKEWQ